MRHLYYVLMILIATNVQAQDLFGSWQGKMVSTSNRYIFSLDVRANPGKYGNAIKAVAMHDRNGSREVLELEGFLYFDNSIYLSQISDPVDQINKGDTFSKLQFLIKYQDGQWVLDGHWQEYEDLRKYRKGRLLLVKRQAKA